MAVARDWRPLPLAVITLVRSGLVDPDWYARQAGRRAGGRLRTALDHELRGRRVGWSPHPLFESEWVGDARIHRRHPVAQYVGGRSVHGGPHPLFDDAGWLAQHPSARQGRGGPLGDFLSRAVAETRVPVPAGQPEITWGQLQDRLAASVDLIRSQDDHRGRRTTTRWDVDREREYLGRWESAGLPSGEGAPLVSVVLPVRNRPASIAAAIASVRVQTLQDWELLVVDDGSTDDTVIVAEAAAAGDRRIRIVRAAARGAAAARNAGLEVAVGRYVAFLDSDNVWVPHFLRVAVAALAASGARAGHAVVELRAGRGRRWLAHEGGLGDLLVANHVDLNTLVVETALVREVGGFAEPLRRMIDWDLVLRLVVRTRLVLLPFVGVHYHEAGTADRISVREPDTWSEVVLARALLSGQAAARVPGRITVALHVRDDWRAVAAGIDPLLAGALAAGADLEVVVSDGGSRPATWRILGARYAGDPRLVLRRSPRDRRWALESMLAATAGSGEVVVLAPTNSAPTWDTVSRLAGELGSGVTVAGGPQTAPDGTLVAAGWGLADGRPVPLLTGHPAEDTGGVAQVPAVAGGPLALRMSDLLALCATDPLALLGPDPYFRDARAAGIDLCMRLVKHGLGGAVLIPAELVPAQATSSWALPLEDVSEIVARWSRAPADPLTSGVWHRRGLAAGGLIEDVTGLRVEVIREPTPGLRWAVKIAAPAGPRGAAWGDTPFAAALAAELEALGQYVAVDRREAHGRPSARLDDVVLNIRGLDRLEPDPSQVNLLWIISHPDQVSAAELSAWDVVFAASEPWAEATTASTGVRVLPLLQATDPARFHPGLAVPDSGEPVLFVGNSRGVFRPVVRDALAAGLDLAVYGGNWVGYLPPRNLRSEFLPNAQVGAAYRAAGVVLSDHWLDMAREGFVSNRVFDAVASGARVISDDVPGIEKLFGGAVRVYRSSEELVRLAGPDRDAFFPDDEGRRIIARQVAREHSFAARASTLLSMAMELRAGRMA